MMVCWAVGSGLVIFRVLIEACERRTEVCDSYGGCMKGEIALFSCLSLKSEAAK
jgi:hypothetical protein